MRELSLFSGAGGGLLGTKLLGWTPIGYVEFNDYCQRVLAQRIKDGHLPEAPIFGDIRSWEMIDFAASLSYNEEQIRKEAEMSAHRKAYLDEAVKLYDSGLSIGMIANHYGVTRQSMYKSLKRRNVNFRNNLKFGKDNHFFRGGSIAEDRIHNLVEYAIRKGTIKRPDKCSKCGSFGDMADGRSSIQAHHDDYNKPTEITWLCQKCHHKWHVKNKAIQFERNNEVSGKCDVVTAGFP